MNKITIKNNERVVFLGATGSGKTVLAKYFLTRLNRVFAIDPKHTLKIDGFRRSKDLPLLGHNFHVIYRPALEDDEHLAHIIYRLNKMKDVTIYCDELATLAENPAFRQTVIQLADVARTGRERRVALWNVVQRPRRVPRIFFTEAEVFFQFNLRSGDDRDYMSEFVGDVVARQVQKYQFWYARLEEGLDPILLRLDLDRGIIPLQIAPLV